MIVYPELSPYTDSIFYLRNNIKINILLVSLSIKLYIPYGVYGEIHSLLGGNIERVKFQYSNIRNDILNRKVA